MTLPAVTNTFKALQKYQNPPAVPKAVWRNPLYFIGFGFGSGAMPVAPGTFGTLMAIPLYLLVQNLALIPYVIFVLAFIAASSWICEKLSHEIHIHDHQGMCIDEFAGFFVTMIHAPIGWKWILLGFILFRLFDIWKPWPIRFADEKIQNGFGMVFDDVLAGIYAMFVIQFIAAINFSSLGQAPI